MRAAPVTEGDGPRPAEILRRAQVERSRAAHIRADSIEVQREARRLAELFAARGGTSEALTRFAALPVACALLDGEARVVDVNRAWRAFAGLGDRIPIGSGFPERWADITGSDLAAGTVATAARAGSPLQMEATLVGPSPRRLLVNIGPATVATRPAVFVVVVDITEQNEREQQLLFQATNDALTGVANRIRLHEGIGDALERLRRYDEPFALVYLDLDGFKQFNDRYGHGAGDVVLTQAARRWERLVRASDLLARVGGDEFVVLVTHLADGSEVEELVARLVGCLSEPFEVDGRDVRLSVTAGIALPPRHATIDDAVTLADMAMYANKRARR